MMSATSVEQTWRPEDRPAFEAFARYFHWAETMRTHLEAQTPEYHDDLRAHWEPYRAYWYGGLMAVIDGWRKLRIRDQTIGRLLKNDKGLFILRKYRDAAFHFSADYFDSRFVALWEQDELAAWAEKLQREFARWTREEFPKILKTTFAPNLPGHARTEEVHNGAPAVTAAAKGPWENQFRLAAGLPAVWVLEARRLKIAAETLSDLFLQDMARHLEGSAKLAELLHLESGPAALLLGGLAIENLAKALVIKREKMAPEENLPRELVIHGTKRLLERAGVNLDEKETALVQKLEGFVTWAGRYPVPKAAASMEPGKTFSTRDFEVFKGLCARLEAVALSRSEKGQE